MPEEDGRIRKVCDHGLLTKYKYLCGLLREYNMKFHDEIMRRRTFAIISHPDAGKTTLTEKFLLFGAPYR
ncbi:hypothetical protein LWM68_03755 [Niabella sp. W65]|nr:hypothetical protein [Niabella sp. W65]MCH7361973.1 hypothetical protein [Niabella sp. W65]ULT45726.1 hypothetical protein KRR40_22310 [Niabella sp. I65]